jgi:hypothetical protein
VDHKELDSSRFDRDFEDCSEIRRDSDGKITGADIERGA